MDCYVIFELCFYYGRILLCLLVLIEVGVKWVVIGMLDFNLRVVGCGVRMLEEVGVEVIIGVWEISVCVFYIGFVLC